MSSLNDHCYASLLCIHYLTLIIMQLSLMLIFQLHCFITMQSLLDTHCYASSSCNHHLLLISIHCKAVINKPNSHRLTLVTLLHCYVVITQHSSLNTNCYYICCIIIIMPLLLKHLSLYHLLLCYHGLTLCYQQGLMNFSNNTHHGIHVYH